MLQKKRGGGWSLRWHRTWLSVLNVNNYKDEAQAKRTLIFLFESDYNYEQEYIFIHGEYHS